MNKIVCFVDESELYLYLDSELPANRQAALKEHIGVCPECLIRYESVWNLKVIMHKACGNIKAPTFLKDQIINRLENTSPEAPIGFWEMAKDVITARPILPIGMAMLLVAALFVAVLVRPSTSGATRLVSDMVHEHDEYISGFASENGIESADPHVVGQWVASNSEIKFDLAQCGKFPSLAGACEITEKGQDVTCLFFDQGHRRVSLFMLRLENNELPKAESFVVNGQTAYGGFHRGSNYLLWLNEDVANILVSKLPTESLIGLAESLIPAERSLSITQ